MPMTPEQIKEMQTRNAAAAAAARTPRTHEQRVELLLGWIVVTTGVLALGTIISVVAALTN